MEAGARGFENLGVMHFGTACLGNKKRAERLAQLTDQLLAHPEGTLPMKLKRPADLRAFYRLVNQTKVTHQAVLQPHLDLTREAMRQTCETVLILNDATELDFDSLESLREQLGQLGNGSHRGYICHNSLAIVAKTKEVIGLANQILFCRPKADPKESRQQRRRKKDRESRLWTQASKDIGRAPADQLWVQVCDRLSDSFEYHHFMHHNHGHYVIRAKHNRSVDAVNDGKMERRKLMEYARSLPETGQRTVEVPPRHGQPGRTAQLRVGYAEIRVRAPKNPRGDHGNDPLTMWLVYAGEINPPEGTDPVEWILETNVPVANGAHADERVDWYCCRWMIEEFHKSQKTGCGIEQMQFTTKAAMEPAIAVQSVVAVILLQLRSASRDDSAPTRPAAEIVPEPFIRVLSVWRWGEVRPMMTVHEFFYALARLGGHQNRKCDGLPGWIVLWRGWSQLNAMAAGAEIESRLKLGKT